jgi:hypothetical protein
MHVSLGLVSTTIQRELITDCERNVVAVTSRLAHEYYHGSNDQATSELPVSAEVGAEESRFNDGTLFIRNVPVLCGL